VVTAVPKRRIHLAPLEVDSSREKLRKFEELAERRVTQALRQIRLIGNLSNRHNYVYTEDHVRQIIDALESALRQLKQRFSQQNGDGGPTFTFRK
jgi:phage-related protein